jgi:hemolysin activation/secretion protein
LFIGSGSGISMEVPAQCDCDQSARQKRQGSMNSLALSTWRRSTGQLTNDELNYIDDLTIGSRYTVRGFSGETMLAAEKGFYWRNELQYPLGQTGQLLYAGLDYGHLWGPSAANLAGTQLAGAAFGLKGSVPSRLGTYSYDVFAGTPIYAPSGFPAPSVTIGFQVSGQF